jgi:translation initiation factor IF-2
LAKVRINDLAKELGVTWKDIQAKCKAEEVPDDVVKSGMSAIPVGLAESIKEWFADAERQNSNGTAIERTEHPKIEELKAKVPAARRKATPADAEQNGAAPKTATPAAQPATPTESTPPPPPAPKPLPVHRAPVAPPPPPSLTPAARAPLAPDVDPDPSHHKAVRLPAHLEPTTAAPTAASETVVVRPGAIPAPRTVTPPPPPGPTVAPVAATPPSQPTGTAPGSGPSGSGGSATATPPSGPTPAPTSTGGPEGAPPSRPVNRAPIKPPVMNVPRRPSVVVPAGQKLEIKTAVKLAGPRVVRIEAPEPASAPPPRRFGPAAPGSGAARPGVSRGPGGDDDRSRRNTRRATGPGADKTTTARRRPQSGSGVPDDLQLGTGFSEQDLAEREERLARASGLLKQRRREAKNRAARDGIGGDDILEGKVQIQAPFTIKDLSAASGIKATDIIKKLFMQGTPATINSGIDSAKAQEIMIDFDIELEVIEATTAEQKVERQFTDRAKIDERPRSPIVTIMGHVDHGKTSLLDAIRKTNVASGEAGGITQKTSAFKVAVTVNDVTKHVVFIDTPGHEAFTEMRARGANITDIVVLVVGAPEGVMPQTVESINHARAAGVQIVVALNKIDSPQATDAQIQKVYGQLASNNLNPVQWGGQTEVIHTSALKGTGIKELLEILELQADVLQLKADFKGAARGRVIESTRDEGRGPIATVLIQDGELEVGDFIVIGRAFGRIRDMTDDLGKRLKTAGPATPIKISGFDEVPDAGDAFFISETLRQAEEAAQQRRDRDREESLHQPKVTLDSLFSQMKDASVKEILIVLKADVQGSVDVIAHQIEKLSSDEVKVRVLHSAVGGITESDIVLADASKAVIVGFNVIPTGKARNLGERKGVEIRTYQVIYDIIDDVKKAASGMLAPEIRQEVLGHAEVRKVFKVTKVGTIAGCYITDGMVQRDALIRVTRNGIVIEQDRVLEQLKRLKDDAKDVKAGMECGMKIVGYDDIKEGDVLECYKKVEIKRTL